MQHIGCTVIKGPPNRTPDSDGDQAWESAVPLKSYHTGGAHILLADGAVRFLSDNANEAICRRLATRDDGQVVGDY